MTNPNLEDQKYLSILTSVEKKINMAKIRINSQELHSEIVHWTIYKMTWVERMCLLYDTERVEYENNFILECPIYTHIRDLNFKIFVAIPTSLTF